MHLTLHCGVSVAYPPDYVDDWELWLTLTAQCDERISYSTLLAQVKIRSMVSTQHVSLLNHCKVKKLKVGDSP